MSDLKIEKFLMGAATGDYVRSVGSQFGSIWGFDGLMVAEATPEQYAAFGARSNIQLCHGAPFVWLGQEWLTILTYKARKLVQVNVHTSLNHGILAKVCAQIESLLGKRQETQFASHGPQQSALSRLIWNGLDGVVCVVSTPTYVQVSIGRYTWLRRVVSSALRSLGISCR